MRTARRLAMVAAIGWCVRGEAVRVLIYDYASTPKEKLEEMAGVVREVAGQAGIQADVELCGRGGCETASQEFVCVVRVRPGYRQQALGTSIVGRGRGGYIDVLRGAAEQLAERNARDSVILGYVVAHELGHLLS